MVEMQRELKFRAWHKDSREMLHAGVADVFIWQHEGQPIEIMQYTGLKDKNGKGIYEGDVLLIPDEYKERILDDGSGPTEPFNHLALVIFQDGSFGVDIKERGDYFSKGFWSFPDIHRDFGLFEFEVIGDIYENPELVRRGDY